MTTYRKEVRRTKVNNNKEIKMVKRLKKERKTPPNLKIDT